MAFYSFSVASRKYGEFFGTVTAKDKAEAEEKIRFFLTTINVVPTTIKTHSMTRVPQKIKDLEEYFSEPKISMALGEGTVEFNHLCINSKETKV